MNINACEVLNAIDRFNIISSLRQKLSLYFNGEAGSDGSLVKKLK